MEASALHAPAGLSRLSLGPLLRLKSDEQLVSLFRAGADDAFSVLVDRYQQRLFAYTRQMLGGSRQDAEDVLQDVFVRAYGSLRADSREVNVRAWLYRVAHNRCIDQLRRPTPPASEVFDMSRKPLHDPVEQAQRREDLRRLVEDVARLPEQQRSALLMREIDGMSYSDLADALETSVPAVKSLLVRARVGLVEAIEARDTDCSVIRVDLTAAYDRGVKASARARRHMRECQGCRDYRTTLRGLRRSFAALTPLGLGPIAVVAQALGIGGAGGGAAASAGAGGGFAATTGTGLGAVSACKVAAVVCTAALATGGAAVEVKKLAVSEPTPAKAHAPAAVAAASGTSLPRGQAHQAAPADLRHTGASGGSVRAATAGAGATGHRATVRAHHHVASLRSAPSDVSDSTDPQSGFGSSAALPPATSTTTPATTESKPAAEPETTLTPTSSGTATGTPATSGSTTLPGSTTGGTGMTERSTTDTSSGSATGTTDGTATTGGTPSDSPAPPASKRR